MASPWTARKKSRLGERQGHERLRAEGGGPSHQLVFTDRVTAALVILRFQLPHAALAVFYGVDRSTVTRAVHEIRPLLAARGFAVPGEAGLRLHTLADVFAYATAKGVELRLDGTGAAFGTRSVVVDVEEVSAACFPMAEVGHPPDIAAATEEGPEQNARQQWPTPRTRTGAECLVDGKPDHGRRLHSPSGDHHEPDSRGRGQNDGQPVGGRSDIQLTTPKPRGRPCRGVARPALWANTEVRRQDVPKPPIPVAEEGIGTPRPQDSLEPLSTQRPL
ncbi:helix-turn-helix domain-containing protein [Streptomyces sp. NPDC002755]|uniref:helix-turn-helix domain-containing protein n=1 Tax=Streptomyces sp. NPDC002884 TaxID=3154544 RepID=UPI0033296618